MDWWAKLIDILSKAFTFLAIIIGGIWSYLKFIRGQLFAIRLEPKVEGRFISHDERKHLSVTMLLKNTAASPVNLSKVILQQRGSALQVFTYEAGDHKPDTHNIDWKHLATFSIFEMHKWIESGEEIRERRLIPLANGDYIAFKLRLRIVSNKLEWNVVEIIDASPTKDAAEQIVGPERGTASL